MATEILFNGQTIEHWLVTRTSGDDEERWEAVDAIRHLCSPPESVPLLLDTVMNDSYWRARGLAVHAFHDIAHDSESRPLLSQAVASLAEVLHDSTADAEFCEQLVEVFLLMGPQASSALGVLFEIAKCNNSSLSAKAKETIDAIQN